MASTRKKIQPPPAVERATRIMFTRLLTVLSRALRDHELTLAQLAALHLVDHAGTLRVTALSDELALSPSAASRFVDDLVQRGLMEREEDPDDRRAKRLQLSAKGAALLQETGDLRVDTLVGVMSEYAPAPLIEAMFKVMGKVK